jgi:hypothetical protein
MRIRQLFNSSRTKFIGKKKNVNDFSLITLTLVGYSSFHLFYILTINDINNSLKKISKFK